MDDARIRVEALSLWYGPKKGLDGVTLASLSALQNTRRRVMRSPYGEPSGALTFGDFGGRTPSHGLARTPPACPSQSK